MEKELKERTFKLAGDLGKIAMTFNTDWDTMLKDSEKVYQEFQDWVFSNINKNA